MVIPFERRPPRAPVDRIRPFQQRPLTDRDIAHRQRMLRHLEQSRAALRARPNALVPTRAAQ